MHTDSTHVMPWRIEDIDLSRIDRRKAASNEHLLLLLCAASFIESGTDLYTSNLSTYFNDDPEVSSWLNNEWEPEEMQHGRALKTYINHVWPEFDWDTAFKNFFAEYSLTCSVEDFEKTRALEMVARCVVETGTATLYRAINECSDEPVLKQLTDNIRIDEVRLLRGPHPIGADGVAALEALPLTAITESPMFKVHASETLQKDTLTVYERT